jgi:hypothetical protein
VLYLKLRAPASILKKKTPYEALYGTPPELSHLRRIGSRAWVLIPKEQRQKIGPRSSECRLLGYCEPNQYKLYEIHSGRTVFSHDVEFDERIPTAPFIKEETSHNTLSDDLSLPVLPKPIGSIPALGPLTPSLSPPNDQREQYYEPPDLANQPNEPIQSEPILQPINPTARDAQETYDLGYSLYGRKRKPSRRLLESLNKAYVVSPHLTSSASSDPLTFDEAISGPNQLEWWAAIQREYRSLLDNGTWEVIHREDVPQGQQIIGCKWVFKTKANKIRKARLVIKGYRQKHGIDYHDTFAAVSRMDSVRCIVASTVLKGWKLHQFDAVTAFLHGDIDTDIYMELPEGFKRDMCVDYNALSMA